MKNKILLTLLSALMVVGRRSNGTCNRKHTATNNYLKHSAKTASPGTSSETKKSIGAQNIVGKDIGYVNV